MGEFEANPLTPEARAVSFIDGDMTVLVPLELSFDMEAISTATECPQERLGVQGISLNPKISLYRTAA